MPTVRYRILIANVAMIGRTGTETMVRDLALGLRGLGHAPMVYSPRLGEIAAEIAAAGVPVVADLRALPAPPDVIHGHHHVETVQALLAFPRTPAIFVCHDRFAWHSAPPLFPRVRRFVAVDLNCRERLAEDYRVPEERIHVVCNAVDMARFAPRPPLPDKPQRALVFSNAAGVHSHLHAVQQACARLRLPLDVIGKRSNTTHPHPEQVLGRYDLVFAKARCAQEALAVGAAVVLCDARGLGPMVTAAEIARLRPWNFGMRLLTQPLEPEYILREIRRYDAADAAAVCRYFRVHADLARALDTYVDLYREVIADGAPGGFAAPGELAEYLAAALQRTHALEQRIAHTPPPNRVRALANRVANKLRVWRARP